MFYNCLIIKIVYISFNMLLNVITAFTAGDTDSSIQIIDDHSVKIELLKKRPQNITLSEFFFCLLRWHVFFH